MRDKSIEFIRLHDLGSRGHRPHGQSVTGGRDPVNDCLRADANEAGGAPEVGAVHDHLEGQDAGGLRITFLAGLDGMAASAMHPLSAAAVFAGFGLAGRGTAGRTRAHTAIFGKSCAKLAILITPSTMSIKAEMFPGPSTQATPQFPI